MSSFSFIHAADIHLDSPLRRLQQFGEETAGKLRTASRVALTKLVDLAISESVAFLIIAGDVYDGDWDDMRTGLFMAQQMGRLHDRGIPVYIIHGNHDAATKMTYNVPFPAGVFVFGHERPETFRLDALDVALHGQSYARQAVTENLALAYPDAVPNVLNIGVLHTCLDGREGHERYAPCSVADLAAKRYDYWALGHVHTRDVVSRAPWIVFPGNLQGRSIRETGERGAMLVTVSDARGGAPVITADFQPLDAARWLLVEIDATKAAAADGLPDLARDSLARARDRHPGCTLVVRLEITGRSAWSDEWIGDQKRWDFELRAIAAQIEDDLVIDTIRFRTRSPGSAVPTGADGDPMAAVQEAIDEYRANPALAQTLTDGLAEIGRKLPADLLRSEEPFSITDPAFLDAMLDEVGPTLRRRLTAADPEE